MQKMLYFCPVDWCWVKQRPQFLAETLADNFAVSVVYPYRNKRKGLQKKHPTNVKLFPLFSFPTLNGRLPFMSKINNVILKLQFRWKLYSVKPDILWLTMPWQLPLLPRKAHYKIIYDCMDDYAAITSRPSERNILIHQENQLLARADIIFASSAHLQKKLRERCADEKTVYLLRNGCNAKWISSFPEEQEHSSVQTKMLKLGYIGTIGRWFDFPLLLNSLAVANNVEYHLYGPVENGVDIPKHKRIIYHGVIEHDQLYQHTKEMHVLMMPFIVNDIVQSVDPVKLYEYIWMNKPILSVYYPEIERFGEFVLFYSTLDEFLFQLEQLRRHQSVKYSRQQGQTFLKENNWDARAAYVYTVINQHHQ